MIEEEQKRGNIIKEVNQAVERKEISEKRIITNTSSSQSVFKNWMS